MIDFCLNTSNVVLSSNIDLIIQQIDLLFDTQVDEVFGEMHYGSYFDQFLWNQKISNQQIVNYTENLIKSNVYLFDYDVSVSVQIYAGTENDIILITVKIVGDFEEYEKTYKLS